MVVVGAASGRRSEVRSAAHPLSFSPFSQGLDGPEERTG